MIKNKTIIGLLALSILILAACNSAPKDEITRPPQYVNMTGIWSFTYGQNANLNSRMSLQQNGFKITGISNNKMGDFKVAGNITGNNLSLQGTDYNTGKNFICVAELTGENTFIGNYTINGKEEKILAKRAE